MLTRPEPGAIGTGKSLGGETLSADEIRLKLGEIHARTTSNEKLLSETIDFLGEVLYLQTGVPGLVIGATRNGQTYVTGFGERSDGSGVPPDGNTFMRIGSITKAFTGQTLARLVARGLVDLSSPLFDLLHWADDGVPPPGTDTRLVRLIHLATHSSGLIREAPRGPSPPNDPYATLTIEAYQQLLRTEPLMFEPGTGVSYSNAGFDLLALALADGLGTPYVQLLDENVLQIVELQNTKYNLTAADRSNVFQGHNFDGSAMPYIDTPIVIEGAGGLYSTPNDILKWLQWHLNGTLQSYGSSRIVDHAAYLFRNGLDPVVGVDESGHMDAMGLAWVVMDPHDGAPLVFQKAGGLQGVFSYAAFSPERNIAAFYAINAFDVSATSEITAAVNALLASFTV
eukprot:ANDGO_04600.mRNA.1 D-alanyl-D-alanine- carboxypeptidase/endopeptidase AmpH